MRYSGDALRGQPGYGMGAVLAWLALASSSWGGGPIQLHDVTRETGISFVHTDGSSGRHYIIETVSAGLATFDYDGDGLIDIYFPNGAPLRGTKVEKPPRHALYKNLGGWRFKDVTEQAGVGCTGYGLGVTVGDYDNDGHPDLYLNNFGPNVLYHNNGDGTFTDVTRQTGTGNGDRVGAGACFLDMDGDGNLDLYVANYVKFSYDLRPTSWRGFSVYPGPEVYPTDPGTLYRNRGDGTFADVSIESGIGKHPGWGMGAVCADYDNDGDTDIYVGNDSMRNFLFQNDGKGKFEEVGLLAGVAYDLSGNSQASMGVGCGDYDNDGRLDFYVTAYQRQLATLYHNLGSGLFEDVTLRTGAGTGTDNNVTWGTDFVDLDNDGFRDIFVGRGHLMDNIEKFDSTATYRTTNLVLRNLGNGKFVNVSDQCGDGLKLLHSARGVAFDDLDNDGDIDMVILNSREGPTILRNMLYESGSKAHWLQLQLQGVKTNRDGVGARVRVVAGDLVQIDEVHSGRGYQSHYGTRLHFGLGTHANVDRIEVRWIGGGVDVVQNVAVDQRLTIREGEGVTGKPESNHKGG